MAILHKAPGGTKPTPNKKMNGGSLSKMSAPQNTAVGSGSRPTKAKHAISTSSPHHPHKLDSRHVAGALGQGKMK